MNNSRDSTSIYAASLVFPTIALLLNASQFFWLSPPSMELVRGLICVLILCGFIFGISAVALSGGRRGWIGISLTVISLALAIYLREKYHWSA
jgi:hypothetical protein